MALHTWCHISEITSELAVCKFWPIEFALIIIVFISFTWLLTVWVCGQGLLVANCTTFLANLGRVFCPLTQLLILPFSIWHHNQPSGTHRTAHHSFDFGSIALLITYSTVK